MKHMRFLVIIMVLMIIGGAFNISPMSCNSSSQLTTDSTEEDSLVYEEVADDDKSLQGLSKLTVSLQGFTTIGCSF